MASANINTAPPMIQVTDSSRKSLSLNVLIGTSATDPTPNPKRLQVFDPFFIDTHLTADSLPATTYFISIPTAHIKTLLPYNTHALQRFQLIASLRRVTMTPRYINATAQFIGRQQPAIYDLVREASTKGRHDVVDGVTGEHQPLVTLPGKYGTVRMEIGVDPGPDPVQIFDFQFDTPLVLNAFYHFPVETTLMTEVSKLNQENEIWGRNNNITKQVRIKYIHPDLNGGNPIALYQLRSQADAPFGIPRVYSPEEFVAMFLQMNLTLETRTLHGVSWGYAAISGHSPTYFIQVRTVGMQGSTVSGIGYKELDAKSQVTQDDSELVAIPSAAGQQGSVGVDLTLPTQQRVIRTFKAEDLVQSGGAQIEMGFQVMEATGNWDSLFLFTHAFSLGFEINLLPLS